MAAAVPALARARAAKTAASKAAPIASGPEPAGLMRVPQPQRSQLPLNPASIPVHASAGAPPAPPRSSRSGPLLPLQCKLAIGSTTDPLEAEADQVADQVMNLHVPSPQIAASGAAPALRRKCTCGGSGGECPECKKKKEEKLQLKAQSSVVPVEAPPSVHQVLRSPGQPLDAHTRAFFEPRLGYDLSQVRVHTDAQAAQSARAVNALAYTVGDRVAFAAGQYSPRSTEGQRLLAHELAHAVQQGSNSPLRHNGGYPAVSGSAPKFSRAAAPIVAREPDPDTEAKRQDYENSVTAGNWEHAAEVLNAFNIDDIHRMLPKPVSQIASIYVGAIANKAVGPDSNVAQVTRWASLDVNYRENLGAGEFGEAAKNLNGFSPDDIKARLRKLNRGQIQSLHDGAVKNPDVGPDSNVAQITGQMLGAQPKQQAAPPPVAEAKQQDQGADQEIADAGAPPQDQELQAKAAAEAHRTEQLECVIRLTGCGGDRSGALDQPEVDQKNETCKQQTGYAGENIFPTNEECKNPPKIGPEEKPSCPSEEDPEITKLSSEQKLSRAWEAAKGHLGADAIAALDGFFSPGNIAQMIAFAVVFIAVEGTPVGWIADAITLIFVGQLLFEIVGDLLEFFAAMKAVNTCQIDQAGHALSQAIIVGGIMAIVELLTHEKPAAGEKPYEPPSSRSTVDAVTKDGRIVRMPEDVAEPIAKKNSAEVKGGELNDKAPADKETKPTENEAKNKKTQGDEESGGSGGASDFDEDVPETEPAEDPKEKDVNPAICFPAGTLVATCNGLVAIEAVQTGDTVYAFDELSRTVVTQKVRAIVHGLTTEWVKIGTGVEDLRATKSHPFWVESEQCWMAAEELRPGMVLLRQNGETLPVVSVEFLPLPENEKTYNLSIESAENYFVGHAGILVHNIKPKRLAYLNRPGYRNYVLKDATGKIYYSGMFGPDVTAAQVQYRHRQNHNRFNPSKGDVFELKPGTRTYGESRLMEQKLAEDNQTIIGRKGEDYRGNRQDPLAESKRKEYNEYKKYREGCG